MYAIRGATTIEMDNEKNIKKAVREMMKEIIERNELETDEIISIIFSSTTDITAMYPARAFRELGYDDIPLFSTTEPPIQGGLDLCIRVLMHIRGDKPEFVGIKHVYKNKARDLRPDLLDENDK